jgi:3-phosphoshikimate 1-carboxyvinyltransferase
MSFAALGVARPGVSVTDPGCVAKSYPGFWSDLRALCGVSI